MQASFLTIKLMPKDSRPKGFRYSHRKDQLDSSIVVLDEQGNVTVDCRIYYPGTVAYCCLWLSSKNKYLSGSGSASGYGYHKQSAALADAIRNLIDNEGKETIRLDKHISGVGDDAMVEACLALAALLEPDVKHHAIRIHA